MLQDMWVIKELEWTRMDYNQSRGKSIGINGPHLSTPNLASRCTDLHTPY